MSHEKKTATFIANRFSTVPILAALLFIASLTWGCTGNDAVSTASDTVGLNGSDANTIDLSTNTDGETLPADTEPAKDNSAIPDAGNGTQDSTPRVGLDYIGLDYSGETNLGSCGPNPPDTTRYAIVGFWKSSDCAGEPLKTNAFPINDSAGCYCWPGNSGENSADSFACDPEAKTLTIVQYNSLTCGAGDDTPTSKTFHRDTCAQDIPPTLYSKIVDMGPCMK